MESTRPSVNVRLGILIALVALGLVLAVILTAHFYEMRQGSGGFRSACNLGQQMNCDLVAGSPYAELVYGIPLSALGAGWYLAMLLLGLGALRRPWRCEALRVLFAMTAIGALASLGYLGVMFGVLQTYCIYCLGLDVIAFAAAATVWSLRRECTFGLAFDGRRAFSLLLGAVVVLWVAVTALRSVHEVRYSEDEIEAMAKEILEAPVVSLTTDQSYPTLGLPSSTVTIVEFSDFQCPFCRSGALTLNGLLNMYPDQVRVVFRHFPLDATCNREVTRTMHPMACQAARAAYCANSQGKFEPLYQKLFEEQASLAPGKPREWALKIGADERAFDACTDSAPTAQAIQRDIDEGANLGVKATPIFFINGHIVKGAVPLPVFRRVIDRLLAGAK